MLINRQWIRQCIIKQWNKMMNKYSDRLSLLCLIIWVLGKRHFLTFTRTFPLSTYNKDILLTSEAFCFSIVLPSTAFLMFWVHIEMDKQNSCLLMQKWLKGLSSDTVLYLYQIPWLLWQQSSICCKALKTKPTLSACNLWPLLKFSPTRVYSVFKINTPNAKCK